MQRKKENVKLKIRVNARAMFFETDYKDVSMRDVAERSEMTVGNIYRYYENKEILFDEIVKGCYEKVIKLIKVSDLVQKFVKNKLVMSQKTIYKNTKFKKFLLETIIKIIADNTAELYILLNHSETSKYSNFNEQVIGAIEETIIKMVGTEKETAEIYAFITIQALSFIMKKYIDDKKTLVEKMQIFFNKLFESFA